MSTPTFTLRDGRREIPLRSLGKAFSLHDVVTNNENGYRDLCYVLQTVDVSDRRTFKLCKFQNPLNHEASYLERLSPALTKGYRFPHMLGAGSGTLSSEGHTISFYFLEWNYVSGEPLRSDVYRKLNGSSLETLAALADHLAVIHDYGIVHGDVKPDNLLAPAGVIDFGVAADTGTLSPQGTWIYSSPEQMSRQPSDHRSDIFGFGATMLYLEAQRPIRTRLNDVFCAPSLDGVASSLRPIVDRCLQPKPEDRYQSARELAEDLRRAA